MIQFIVIAIILAFTANTTVFCGKADLFKQKHKLTISTGSTVKKPIKSINRAKKTKKTLNNRTIKKTGTFTNLSSINTNVQKRDLKDFTENSDYIWEEEFIPRLKKNLPHLLQQLCMTPNKQLYKTYQWTYKEVYPNKTNNKAGIDFLLTLDEKVPFIWAKACYKPTQANYAHLKWAQTMLSHEFSQKEFITQIKSKMDEKEAAWLNQQAHPNQNSNEQFKACLKYFQDYLNVQKLYLMATSDKDKQAENL